MSNVHIILVHKCTHSHQSEEQYGSWSEDYDFSVVGASLKKPRGYTYETYSAENYAGDDLTAGDTIYAIIAVWGSGDSFGHAGSSSYDVAIINKDKALAEANLAILKAATDNERGPLMLSLDDGSSIAYGPGWTGYFESLEQLEIHELTIA